MSKLVELGVVSADTRQATPYGNPLDGTKRFDPTLGFWVYMKVNFVPGTPPQPAPVG